jgi:hypothetical protein
LDRNERYLTVAFLGIVSPLSLRCWFGGDRRDNGKDVEKCRE